MSNLQQTVERLNELHAMTTPGVWYASPSGLRDHFDGVYLEHKEGRLIAETYFSDTDGQLENASNTQFIEESHNAWPAIAAELTRLREFEAAVRDAFNAKYEDRQIGNVEEAIDDLDRKRGE